jgi:phosphatidylinositol-3-phosphatase
MGLPAALAAPRTARLAAGVALAAAVAALVALPAGASRPSVAPHTSGYHHVIEVVMENLDYSSANSYPGYQTLAHEYASATNSYADAHPSLPNYLDLTGGSTFGISSDCTSCYVTANNLGAQLSAKHLSWDDFSEGVPGSCFLGSQSGLYAAKHNPFRYYNDIRRSRAMCHHLLTLNALTRDLRRAATLPKFSFVTPNLCHDGHDCSPSVAFSWLSGFVRSVTSSPGWRQQGLLIVTWDEGADGDTSSILPSGQVRGSGGGGHIATLLIAPGVKAGTVVTEPITHASLLASIESNFNLAYLRGAAAWAGHTLVLP